MLEIKSEVVGPGVIVIRLEGKLIMGPESAAMESFVAECLERGDKNLVFDLAQLKQIDSTGIGRFISTFNRLMQVKGSIGMAASSQVVRQSFRVTRLDTVFKFYDTVGQAIDQASAANPA
jgi:anti-sigma B factor antagonist